MAIAGRKSEGARGYGPNVRGPRREGHVAKGRDNTTAWEKLLPTFDFSFRDFSFRAAQTVQTVSLRPRPPCRPLLSVLALFFLFSLSSEPVSCDVVAVVASTSPRPHTGDIPSAPPRHRNYRTNPVAATTAAMSPFAGSQAPAGLALSHTRRGHTQATPPPSPSLCLVHLKKASDKSFPLFFPFVFNGAGHLPSTQARCTPCGTQTPTPPPLARMQAPQCLYDRRPFPDPVALQPASPDFATQTGGAKGALAPTISARPPFAHPPPLCRSSHSRGCPRCAPRFTRPAPPRPAPPASSPACRGAQEGQRAPSPLFRGYAARKGKGRVQGEGEGPGGMHARGRAACKGRGRVCERASGAAHEQKGARTLSAPPAPSRST